jgi:outer membrane receptor for ferrienterochelin and colicins
MNRPFAVALPFLAVLSAPSAAQTAPEPIQKVQVTGAATDTRRTDTAARLTVGRDELARYGDSTLSAALKRQPGIAIVNGEVRMRGLGAGYTQILVNGEPVAPGFSIDSIAPSLIDRIDILRSGSAEFGTQAIAGTINVILKKAGGSAQQDLTLGMGAMPGRADPAASLRISDRRGPLAWSLAADLARPTSDYEMQVQERFTGATGAVTDDRTIDDRIHSTTTRLGLAPRATWTFAGGDSVAWTALLERSRPTRQGVTSETRLAGSPSEYPENTFRLDSTTHSERSDVTWTHTVGADGKLLVKAGINRNQRDNDYLFRGTGADQTLARSVLSNVIDNTANLNGKYLTPLGGSHSLGLGWESGRTTRSEFRLQRDASFSGEPLGVLDENYDAVVTRMAAFAQDEWSVTPRLQAYLGMRWEGLRTVTDGRTLDQVRSRASVLSPIASLLWKLPESEKVQLRLSLSRSYKAPTPGQLVPRRYTTNNGNSQVNSDYRGNPGLRPELAWGIDAGYERYFAKGGMFSLSGYARRIDDVIVTTLEPGTRPYTSSPLNSGRATVWGLEWDTKYALGPSIDVRANAARNWSRLEAVPGPDNRLASQVAASANVGLDWRQTASHTLGMNLNLQFGGQVRQSAELDEYTGPVRTLDLYSLWKFDKTGQLRLSVSDLLAPDRASRRTYLDDAGGTARFGTERRHALLRLVLEKKL